jgi:hypothetical protein
MIIGQVPTEIVAITATTKAKLIFDWRFICLPIGYEGGTEKLGEKILKIHFRVFSSGLTTEFTL